LRGIKPAPSTVLDPAMRQDRFIVDSHTVDMDSATCCQYAIHNRVSELNGLTRIGSFWPWPIPSVDLR
jgi:hypothetical protein